MCRGCGQSCWGGANQAGNRQTTPCGECIHWVKMRFTGVSRPTLRRTALISGAQVRSSLKRSMQRQSSLRIASGICSGTLNLGCTGGRCADNKVDGETCADR